MATAIKSPHKRATFRQYGVQPEKEGRYAYADMQIEDSIDCSDPWLHEIDDNLPMPSERNLSLDELERLVVADITSICNAKNAVQV